MVAVYAGQPSMLVYCRIGVVVHAVPGSPLSSPLPHSRTLLNRSCAMPV